MNTSRIIAAALEAAKQAQARGVPKVILPVMEFKEWSTYHFRPDNLASREAFRAEQKRSFYFKKFLQGREIEVALVVCRADQVIAWAEEHDHPLTNDQERTHVLAHYSNQPDIAGPQCVHKKPDPAILADLGLQVYGTLSIFGESPDAPEILSAVVHTREGQVVDAKEILAAERETEEAFGLASEFFRAGGVKHAFLDQQVRRPEFCPDCHELLLNVASDAEYEQLQNQGRE
ncbi:MAG: hypothetical protein V1816_00675 [Pseudomonadota bacterium]